MSKIQDTMIAKFGNPLKSEADRKTFEAKHMGLFVYPDAICNAIPSLGVKLYCNRDFWGVWLRFLNLLIERDLHHEINSNDECFMPRYQRGSTTQLSIHSWGMAADLNPSHNPLGLTRDQAIVRGLKPFSKEFQQAARDAGLICGIDFPGRPDGMHFEATKGLY